MKKKAESFNPYCDVCGGCGDINCDGIEAFLRFHVKGKTDCKNESLFIQEIIDSLSPTVTKEEEKEFACQKHNRILIGKKYCVDCVKNSHPKKKEEVGG